MSRLPAFVFDDTHLGREAGAAKLADLRVAWLKYTCPAVSEAAQQML